MKVTYQEKVQTKTAFSRKMYCPCGSHKYQIVEDLDLKEPCRWSVRCPQCGKTTWMHPIKEAAIAAWKCGRYDVYE